MKITFRRYNNGARAFVCFVRVTVIICPKTMYLFCHFSNVLILNCVNFETYLKKNYLDVP